MSKVKKKSSSLKLSIIIPAYNEEATIAKMIAWVSDLPLDKEIIVVDDGSTDRTLEVLKEISSKFSFSFFIHERNQGKGAAVKTGVKKARGEYVIIQDADLEYHPRQIKKLLRVAEKEGLLVVYGSRFAGKVKEMDLSFRLGNIFLTFLTNLLFGTDLTDMETCYKFFRREVIQGIDWQSKSFDFEPEITARVLKKGIKIREIPVFYKARKKEQGKKINWRDGIRAALVLFRLRFS